MSELQFDEDPILPTRPSVTGFSGYPTQMQSGQQNRFQNIDNTPFIVKKLIKFRIVKTETQAQIFVILFLVIVAVATVIILYRTSANSDIIRL